MFLSKWVPQSRFKYILYSNITPPHCAVSESLTAVAEVIRELFFPWTWTRVFPHEL